MAQKLTDTIVKTLPAPAKGNKITYDSEVKGFGVRVTAAGARSFILNYRIKGRERRYTIGSHPDWKTTVARDEAMRLKRFVDVGEDPLGSKEDERQAQEAERRKMSVGDMLDAFVTDHAEAELKEKTSKEYGRIVRALLKPALGELKIDAIEPKDVARFYRANSARPTQAAAAVRVLSSAMSWAEESGLRAQGTNPAKIRLKGSRRRTRLFSELEVARLQAAIGKLEDEKDITATVARGLRLLFATGCRAGEVCTLRWSDIDFEAGTMRWGDSKTGYLEKPITQEARALLKAAQRVVGIDWVCPSNRPAKALRVETLEAGFEQVMAEAKVEARENATLHLIRHWFATKIYTDKSISLPVQMAIVGHKSVATAMRYAHVTPDEMVAAAQEAAQRRGAAVEAAGKRGAVVALQGVAR